MNNPYAQNLIFCERGLDRFPIGNIISVEALKSLYRIDTSTIEGLVELQGASMIHHDKKISSYLKVDLAKYQLPVQGIKCIYIGLTEDNEIRKITVKLESSGLTDLIKLFDQLYATSDVDIETHVGDEGYSSRIWTTGRCEVYLSGITGSVYFYCFD
ncbi:hypothetical protein GVN16_10030 [Emticicia sp. CRIBPO]|uniref:hypothetical protein n=1 Tax=Emticicia sp. CRIBPO TaxID=2683258 RepID=UPI001411FE7B|nr:hypothetical protein [Emticicia sp. CRIBPO]NBA86099.1 hypothetical protein [Emticicia sp. CRIBPO]